MASDDPLVHPPKNIPYLVSTLGDIMKQQKLIDVHKARWSATYPFWYGTHEAKVQWLRAVELGNDGNCLHDVKDALKEILCETVRSPVVVQLLVRAGNIPVLKTVHGRVLNTSSIYNVAQGRPPAPIMYIVAEETVHAGTRSDVLIPKLLQKAGYPGDVTVRCAPPRGGIAMDSKFNEEWPEFVGEGVHFPQKLPPTQSAVAFEIVSIAHTLPPYERELQALAPKYAILMPNYVLVRKDELMLTNVTPTAASHDPVWYCERIEFERCRWHVRKGLGETDEVRRTLDNGGSPAAKLRLSMIQCEVNYIKRIGGPTRWRRKMATILALTLEIRRDREFITLSGRPAEAQKVLHDLAELWRSKLLASDGRSNEELGLCFAGNIEMGIRSRKALVVLLKRIQGVVETTKVPCFTSRFNFCCVPRVRGPPRQAPKQAPVPVTNLVQNAQMRAAQMRVAQMSQVKKVQGMPIVQTTAGLNQVSRTQGVTLAQTSAALKQVTRPQGAALVQTTAGITAQKVVTNPSPGMTGAKKGGATVPVNGGSQRPTVTGSQNTNVNVTSNQMLRKAVPVTSAGVPITKPVSYKRRIPGATKPAGRTPNDSNGTPMKWDSAAGLWRSATNPGETKLTNVKVARTTVITGIPKPDGTVPVNGEGQKPAVTSTQHIVPATAVNQKAVVGMAPVAGSTVVAQALTTVKRRLPGTTQPAGRAPNDSNGTAMKWDSIAGVWRSTTVAGETKMTNSRTCSVVPPKTS